MSRYRQQLPQLQGHTLLTDGGMETTLVFHEQIELPEFASYTLLETTAGRKKLDEYFQRYLSIARNYNCGFVLESPTWRTNPDWCARLGHNLEDLKRINQDAIELLEEYRWQHDSAQTPYVISGCIGPRHDAYAPEMIMTPAEAKAYHTPQIQAFAATTADYITAMTITNINEAIGIVLAAQEASIPAVISFTLETDGCLPTGESLNEAIQQVDSATHGGPAYYMINCAHPTHFREQLAACENRHRIQGIRANASKCSHAELNESAVLDEGNPAELGHDYSQLANILPELRVLGGCCGTDHRHIEQIWAQHHQVQQQVQQQAVS